MEKKAKFETFTDKASGPNREHRFHLRGKNGEIQAQSEGYRSKDGVDNGIAAVKRSVLETCSSAELLAELKRRLGE